MPGYQLLTVLVATCQIAAADPQTPTGPFTYSAYFAVDNKKPLRSWSGLAIF